MDSKGRNVIVCDNGTGVSSEFSLKFLQTRVGLGCLAAFLWRCGSLMCSSRMTSTSGNRRSPRKPTELLFEKVVGKRPNAPTQGADILLIIAVLLDMKLISLLLSKLFSTGFEKRSLKFQTQIETWFSDSLLGGSHRLVVFAHSHQFTVFTFSLEVGRAIGVDGNTDP